MRAVIQRVKSAGVTVAREEIGAIGPGLLVLLGVKAEDTSREAVWLAEKIPVLRIFEDDQGKMNLSLLDVGGEILVVSQFTLYADMGKGRRPSFTQAADPEKGKELYDVFVAALQQQGVKTATGQFQAHMEVALINDGPVTLIMDSQADQ